MLTTKLRRLLVSKKGLSIIAPRNVQKRLNVTAMSTEKTPSVQETKQTSKTVKVNVTITDDIYARARKAKTAKGLLSEQDVFRLALIYYLDAMGF